MPRDTDLYKHGTQLHSNEAVSAMAISSKGMAHFADPSSRNECGTCQFFKFNKNAPKARQVCSKYKEMMGRSDPVDRKFGPGQRACKYFVKGR